MTISYSDLVNANVFKMPVYEPGKPIEYVAREFGLDPHSIIKLASNENSNGASPKALEAVKNALTSANRYPDGGAISLRDKLARHWNMSANSFFIGNGSNEALMILGQMFLTSDSEVIFGEQAFIVYKILAQLAGAKTIAIPMPNYNTDLEAIKRAITDKTRLIFISNPNNPQGTVCDKNALLKFAEELPEHVILCVDEAYAEFSKEIPDFRPLIAKGKKIICARTFSKVYGLSGFRIGYFYGSEELIALMNRVRQPFNVNLLAQIAATAAIDDVEFFNKSFDNNELGKQVIYKGLEELGLSYVPTESNFILFHVEDGAAVFDAMQRAGVIIRPMKGYGMPNSLRVTIGTPAENKRFLETLKVILKK